MDAEREVTTEELALRAAESSRAFDELARRIDGRLRMWINLRMGPLLRTRLTEEDVMQETLLQVHRTVASFQDNGPGSFRRWLFSVAENRLRDLHKYHSAQKRDAARDVDIGPRNEAERGLLDRISASGTSPSSGANRLELAARVIDRLRGLPDDEREIFVLRVVEDCTFAEIASRIGRPATTIQSLFGRALRMMRDGFAV